MPHAARDAASPRWPVVLDGGVCRALVRHRDVGRLAYVADGRPHVVAVNYGVDADRLVLQMGDGATFRAISRGAPVAVQVDGVDELYRHGWSVTVHGRAVEVVEPAEVDRLRGLAPRPWAGGDRPHVLRIDPDAWTGRRIGSPP